MDYLVRSQSKDKLFVHKIFKLKVLWDEEPTTYIVHKYLKFRNQLQQRELQIDRRILPDNHQSITSHGFADASDSDGGCGAAVYIRTINHQYEITVK